MGTTGPDPFITNSDTMEGEMVKEIVPEFQKDAEKLPGFVSMFCRAHHEERNRGAFSFTYRRIPLKIESSDLLCSDCTSLLRHAIVMRVLCPLDPKPKCRKCPQNCYRPIHRDAMDTVMRYAGPRSLFRRG